MSLILWWRNRKRRRALADVHLEKHVYSPLPPNASTEEIRAWVQGAIPEMEAFRDYLRARRLASETERDRGGVEGD